MIVGVIVVIACVSWMLWVKRHDLYLWRFRKAASASVDYSIKDNSSNDPLLYATNLFFGSSMHEPDYKLAFEYYEKAFNTNGSPEAAHMLGLYFGEGIGVEPDPGRALALYTLSANAGYLPSQLTLAYWYQSGLHVEPDCDKAKGYLLQAAKQVDQEVKNRKRKYLSVVPPESLTERSKREDVMAMFPSADLIEYYKYSADKGQVESQTILGQVYYHGGADWDPDFEMAFNYFKTAAKDGGAVAMGYLGQMYLRGEFVQVDHRTAYKYFKASAERGSAMGLNGMGLCYWRGIEVVQDYDEAWSFFDKAIAKEHTEAHYNAAMMLKEWNAVLYADTISSYLMRAVKAGHLISHYELARTYEHEQGFCSLAVYLLKTFNEKGDMASLLDDAHKHFVKKNFNQAISRYLFMGGQGYEVAQSNLAYLINDHDPKRAAIWWNRAANQGNLRARVRTGDYFFKSGGELGLAASAANYVAAALRKDPQANFNMALAYTHGSGVPVDRELAALFFQDTIKFDKRAAWPIFFTKLWIGWRDTFTLDTLTSFLMVILIVVIVVSGTFVYTRHTIRLRRRLQGPVRNEDIRQENPIVERGPPVINEQPTVENEQPPVQRQEEVVVENVNDQVAPEGNNEIIPQAESNDQVLPEHIDHSSHSSDYVTTEEEQESATPTIQTD